MEIALFRGATDIPWTIYTKDGSKTHPHPVIFACGASYLEAREGSDGVIRGYDEFTNTYEPLDAELEACNTIGPYQPAGANDPNTTFALQRAVTPVNDAQSEAPRRTVMRLCASALEDKQDDNAQIAIDLLDASKLAIAVAVNIKRNLKTMVRMRWTIDYFMGPDFYILMMVLEYAGGKPTEVTGKQWQQDLAIYGRHWAQCVAQKNADLRKFERPDLYFTWPSLLTSFSHVTVCQAYYGFALAFGFVDLYVNPAGECSSFGH